MTLRCAEPGDREFLYEVFVSAGPALEFQSIPESPRRRQLFEMQFRSWHAGHSSQYGEAGLRIVISAEGAPMGYVWLYHDSEEHRIVDIALAAAVRGQGLGTELVTGLIAEAHAAGKPMRASVGKSNTGSLRFNWRLGAVIISETATHWAIEWPVP